MIKMTDEEIINALKKYIECAEGTQIARDVGGTLVISLLQNALDIINRLQEENEELKTENQILSQKRFNIFERIEYSNKLKSKTIKEFAERLNKEAEKVEIDREGDFIEADNKIYDTVANWCKTTSDNISKEMVGEGK